MSFSKHSIAWVYPENSWMPYKAFTVIPNLLSKLDKIRVIGKDNNLGLGRDVLYHHTFFVIVMTVIFRDVHDGLNLSRGTLDGLSFTELLYADDTVLITNNVNAMNRFLRNVEKCARYHGLSFNKDKCVSMNFHCEAKTKYADGTKVPCSDAVTYLGAELTKLGSARKEINRKIS